MLTIRWQHTLAVQVWLLLNGFGGFYSCNCQPSTSLAVGFGLFGTQSGVLGFACCDFSRLRAGWLTLSGYGWCCKCQPSTSMASCRQPQPSWSSSKLCHLGDSCRSDSPACGTLWLAGCYFCNVQGPAGGCKPWHVTHIRCIAGVVGVVGD